MSKENNPNLTEMIREIHDGVAREMYCKGVDDFVKFASDMPTIEAEDGTIRPMWLEEIAEQLKGSAPCVSNDVCEWGKGSSGYVGYPAYYSKCCATKSKGLEMQTHIIADWKYCPYCGKKIKVVE